VKEETKFTKGKWTAVRLVQDDGAPMRGEAAKKYVCAVIDAGGERDYFAVCGVDDKGTLDICHTGNGPTSPMNANLISTAPEMHKILEDVQEFMSAQDIWNEPVDAPDRQLFQRVIDILKKARGE
jgi:hypothetical protein